MSHGRKATGGNLRPRPLIEEIEGRDQDDRAALRAAWRRLQASRGRAGSTDLHVRELLFHVFARDRSGANFGAGQSLGVQLSYSDLAAELETTPKTARSVVARAVDEFGLLLVREQRYVSGGQSANRYAIDWAAVRAVNNGTANATHATPANVTAAADLSDSVTPAEPASLAPSVTPAPVLVCQPSSVTPAPESTLGPPALSGHPPVLSGHPPVLSGHPYKELPRITPRITPPPPPTDGPEWPVVVSVLVSLGMSGDGAASAIAAAQRRDLTPADGLGLVDLFRRVRASGSPATPGWLYRWFTGQSVPPLDPAATSATPARTAISTTSPTTQRENLRARIVKAGRLAGVPEAAIDRRVQEALAAFDRTAAPQPQPEPQPQALAPLAPGSAGERGRG
jgi:hypothetical protein